MRKDEYLTTIMQLPPKQRIAITPFDQRTQREAFSVSLEGLKGVSWFNFLTSFVFLLLLLLLLLSVSSCLVLSFASFTSVFVALL